MVNFLRNKAGMKTRLGVVGGQRADYFKGTAAVKAILSPAYAKLKDVPRASTEEEAERLLHGLLPYAFFLRVDRGVAPPSGKDGAAAPRPLQVVQMQMFEKDGHYVWLYEGSQVFQKLAGLGLVVVLLTAVMFPLWPLFLRRGVYYLSLGVLGLFGLLMVLAVVRLILWVITIVVVPPGIWLFPNLFADVGVIESFIPLWAWDVPPEKKKVKRTKKKTKRAGAAVADAPAAEDAPATDDVPATADAPAAPGDAPGDEAPAPAAASAASKESAAYADLN